MGYSVRGFSDVFGIEETDDRENRVSCCWQEGAFCVLKIQGTWYIRAVRR